MEPQEPRLPSISRDRFLHTQGSILTWLIGLVIAIMLIPPAILDDQHCSFLNITSSPSPSNTTNISTPSQSFIYTTPTALCIHAGGTGIYTDHNDSTQVSLSNITLSSAELGMDVSQLVIRSQVSKWMFVALLVTASLWWHLWWTSSYMLGSWILWGLSAIEALVVIIIAVATRDMINESADIGPETSVSYGTIFFACLLILSLLLGAAFHAFSPHLETVKLRFRSIPMRRLHTSQTS